MSVVQIGDTYGRLTVIGVAPMRSNASVYVKCRCDCGTAKEIRAWNLRNGHTQSCGCLNREKTNETNRKRLTTHGCSPKINRTPEYCTWRSMITRCTNPNCRKWHLYGGRGITICEEWRHDFLAFLEHVGPRPSNKHSIDRIDPDGNYEPGNVRWADIYTQNRNRKKRKAAV